MQRAVERRPEINIYQLLANNPVAKSILSQPYALITESSRELFILLLLEQPNELRKKILESQSSNSWDNLLALKQEIAMYKHAVKHVNYWQLASQADAIYAENIFSQIYFELSELGRQEYMRLLLQKADRTDILLAQLKVDPENIRQLTSDLKRSHANNPGYSDVLDDIQLAQAMDLSSQAVNYVNNAPASVRPVLPSVWPEPLAPQPRPLPSALVQGIGSPAANGLFSLENQKNPRNKCIAGLYLYLAQLNAEPNSMPDDVERKTVIVQLMIDVLNGKAEPRALTTHRDYDMLSQGRLRDITAEMLTQIDERLLNIKQAM